MSASNFLITVELTPSANDRLQKLSEQVGIDKVQVFREALRLYEWAVNQYASGADFYAVGKDGTPERVSILGSTDQEV